MLAQTLEEIARKQGKKEHPGKTVLYARVSTKEQAEDKGDDKKTSKDVQIDAANDWLIYKKLPLLEQGNIYFDTFSGTNTDRPQLEKIMREAKQGSIATILVWKIDRFARNVRDFLNLLHELEQYDVRFCSVSEGLDTSNDLVKATTKLMMTIYSLFGEHENKTRHDRLYNGRLKKWERDGTWIGGTAPFGYQLDKATHTIKAIKDEGEIINSIYDFYLEFKSISRVIREIKKEAEKKQVKIRFKLDRRQIGRVLRNPLYTGHPYIKKYKFLHPDVKHDVIIEQEKFNRVQALRTMNYQGHRLAWSVRSPGFLFRDRAICGHCGRCMVAHHAPVHLRYYSCNLRRKEGKTACVHKKCHRHDRFDQNNLVTVIEHLKLIISQPGYLEEKMSLISLKETNDLKKKIKDRRIHLSKIEGYKEKWRRLFEEDASVGKEMIARIKGFEDDCFRAEQEILELEAEIEDVLRKRMDVNKAKQFAREFEKNFECANEDQRRDMINAVVKQVRVFNDTHTEFDFNF